MASSRIGAQASNVIPASASVTMDVRLVKGMDPRTTAQRVTEHIRKQGFFVVDQEPSSEIRMAHAKVARVIVSGAEAATRTPMDLPISQEVIRVVESARGPKLAVNGITCVLARELGPRGIRVNAIAPGPTDTEALRAQVPQDYIKSMLAQMPLARLGTPQDLLKALVFLLSEDAAWVTGLVMNVDGGQWMRA